MAERTPSSKPSISNTPVRYTRTVIVPSITLNKGDFNTLISILQKTCQPPIFTIYTNQEELTFPDIQFLANRKWPAGIKELSFHAGYYGEGRNIKGRIYTNNVFGSTDITIEDNDRDWISARSDELRQFFAQNRNWHHLFHNIKYTVVQGIAFASLLIYLSVTSFGQRGWKDFAVLPAVATVYLTFYLYSTLLPNVFPFLVLEPEQPSFYTRLRSALKYLIPAIFAGLIVEVVLISLP